MTGYFLVPGGAHHFTHGSLTAALWVLTQPRVNNLPFTNTYFHLQWILLWERIYRPALRTIWSVFNKKLKHILFIQGLLSWLAASCQAP